MVQPAGKIPSCFPVPFPSLLLLLLLLLLPPLTIAKFMNGPSSVGVPTIWMLSNLYDFNTTKIYTSSGNYVGVRFKVVLSRLNTGPSFLCGFMDSGGGSWSFHLLVFQPTQDMKNIIPSSVWSIPHEPMNDTSQMRLTKEGDLVLLGDDGKIMWSTNTAGKSVGGLNLTEVGNLVLYNTNDAIIWQSFDHPVDTILPGQELRPGMKLTRPSSAPDGTALFYTFATDDQIGFLASVRAAYSPQIYYETSNVRDMKSDDGQVRALYNNGTFGELKFSPISSAQFIRLGDHGHLKRHVYDEHSKFWNKAADLLEDKLNKCDYPLACGSYGICSNKLGRSPTLLCRTTKLVRTSQTQLRRVARKSV
ncbi:EP1-like glycoprotein 2 [Eucalyptus grandis]|uniref:EP1-like glycoprotein 2 n=1 Tax=Eucalyptus grandis TaxID=71139 RepID=UPI00192E9505|nr:EP1-like glycoprotein 2 [Eucalyptus grandis]